MKKSKPKKIPPKQRKVSQEEIRELSAMLWQRIDQRLARGWTALEIAREGFANCERAERRSSTPESKELFEKMRRGLHAKWPEDFPLIQ